MIPTIDPKVRHVGSSYLRGLNSDQLRQLEGAVVVQDSGDQPLVVIVPYETYLKLQQAATDAPFMIAMTPERNKETLARMSPFSNDTLTAITHLDATGPELSSGKGKATVETRGIRPKGDSKR